MACYRASMTTAAMVLAAVNVLRTGTPSGPTVQVSQS